MQTIYVSGMSQIILGIQTLLYVQNYNCFGDFASMPLIFTILIMCFSIHRFVLWGGGLCDIWKIDEKLEGIRG